MAEKWKAGAQVVYGKRGVRRGESKLKLLTAKWYYRVLRKLAGNAFPEDTGDFRLADRKVVDVVRNMPEHARYLRGMFAWAGFKQEALVYERDKRFAGETHYPLKKMLKLAAHGVMSFSEKPLLWPLWLGLVLLGIGAVVLLKVIVLSLLGYNQAASVVPLLLLLGFGAVLSALGVIGAYLARVYEEVRSRPLYVVARTLGFDKPALPPGTRIKA